MLAAAVIVVLALAGVGALLLGQSSQDPAPPSTSTPAMPAPPPPPAAAPEQTGTPPPPPAQPVDLAGGPIAWSSAGQLVIDYYNGLADPSSAWQLLSPAAQATFGSEAEFAAHWSQYSSVSAEDASGVTDNSDGSVSVPVTVTYDTGGGQEVERQNVRVTRLEGRLLIDSDPR